MLINCIESLGKQWIEITFAHIALLISYSLFRLMGTPNNEYWNDIESLPYYRNNFPQWPPLKLDTFLVDLPAAGINLLEVRNCKFIELYFI